MTRGVGQTKATKIKTETSLQRAKRLKVLSKTKQDLKTIMSTMSRETRRRHETVEASQQRAERLLRLEVLRNQSNKDLNGSKTKQGLKTISQQRKIQL